MALFELTIPDELLPALVVEFGLVSAAGGTDATTPAEYFAASVVETVRQRAEIYKVGPYYVGITSPTWNADGTPYVTGGEDVGGVMAGSTTLVRARNADGAFIADDPSTPDVNEAWVAEGEV